LSALIAAALASLALAATPAPPQLPTSSGETGLVDVPDAEVQGVGNGQLGVELRLDHQAGRPTRSGPLPLSAVGGLTQRIDLGFSLRQWGQPGDPANEQLLFGAAAKLQLSAPAGLFPGVAVDATLDRLNADPALGARLIVSSARTHRLRLAAMVGGETSFGVTSAGLTFGGALAFTSGNRFEGVLEGHGGPRGKAFTGALRWAASPTVGLQLALTWLPDDDGLRLALGVGFGPRPKPPAEVRPVEEAAKPEEPEAPAAVAAWEERPRFRLKLHVADPATLGEPRHLQNAPYTPPAVAGGPPRLAAPPRAGGAPGGDLLENALKEQELQLAARLKRLRATDDDLSAREEAVQAEGRRLTERSDQLAAREQQLDAREKRIQLRGAPTQQQRTLESQEAQLAATERQLTATERGLVPAVDAALGSERDAAGREQGERSERERLAALAGLEKVKARQLDLRRQAVAATQRLLAAMEARLLARGERLDAVERQLRTRGERLDATQRRLDVRAERLDLMEKRALDQQRGVEGERPATAPAPAQPKDKAVFVMVVKSPTAIMKEPAAKDGAAGARREAVHPGVAVEKAVAAATVVTFSSPTARLSELDRESIDGIARLAAREGCELLIWARAKDPANMTEAIRRSEEIKGYVINTASLSPKQVVTRITTRPGAQGVDVVVSALRESGKAGLPAPAPAGPTPEAPAPGRPSDKLVGGETTRRQIRDAVIAVQPSIERCVGDQMLRRGLARAEGTLKLTVAPQGRVTSASTGGGQLAGPELEECLRAASAAWLFPPADTEYVVDVPITVVRGGTAR
jgi:hypothetical protein